MVPVLPSSVAGEDEVPVIFRNTPALPEHACMDVILDLPDLKMRKLSGSWLPFLSPSETIPTKEFIPFLHQ
jgi:hypothetical protein